MPCKQTQTVINILQIKNEWLDNEIDETRCLYDVEKEDITQEQVGKHIGSM